MNEMLALQSISKRSYWRVAASFIWLILVVLGSLLPTWKLIFHTHGRYHLLIHFGTFTMTGIVVMLSLPRHFRAHICAALIALAFTLEGIQSVIYPIRFEWRDFLTDNFGILVACLVMSFTYWLIDGVFSRRNT